MKIEAMADNISAETMSVLKHVKGKYSRAIYEGEGGQLDELFKKFGMNADEIKCARELVDAVFLHSAIIGSE